jgi:tetratricopeptide (TPR) repeat protein
VTLLGRAVEDLREQSRSAKAKSVDLERSRIERQQWIDATFKDGKLYYDNAEYEKAAATWEPLLPYLAEERAMRGLIQTLRENAGDVAKAKREADEYKNKTDIRFDLPVDVAAMASDAIGRLNREVLEAQQQKTRAEQSLKERQQWVVSTFQEGKMYYDQKQYREALEQWEKLTPFVDEKTGFRQLVETVRQSYKESLEAKRGAVEAVANEYKGLKLAYADEMIMLLSEANKRLKSEALDANTKREAMEKSLAERREWIVNTFNKGKIFYDQGSFQEAVEQWDRLLPYLEPGSEMKRTIESIKDNYTAMTTAKQAVQESSSAQPVTR